jgi:hypothetical protein
LHRHAFRLLPLLALVACAVAALPNAAAPAPAVMASPALAAAQCCAVTYNDEKTHVQVTGVVAYKGDPILFSFHGPCASPAGPGLASIKSRWIPLKTLKAGYHRITVVQRVNGRIVTTFSPKFFVKGKAQLAKPSARILSGPSGVVQATSAVFEIRVANTERFLCRLDSQPWKACASRYMRYESLKPGPHVFTLRAYALSGSGYVEAKRSFTVSAPPPG